jgi:hypothetical protein
MVPNMEVATPETHVGEVHRVLNLLTEVGEQADLTAEKLGADGAQPHLVAALNDIVGALGEQRRRLARATEDEAEEQQRLTI